jgi:hypothetical protein
MIKGSDVGTGYDPVHKNISGLQKKGGITHQQMMLMQGALSTGESGTFKSTAFGGHQFRFNP